LTLAGEPHCVQKRSPSWYWLPHFEQKANECSFPRNFADRSSSGHRPACH
jgi:hypothetical protein